MLIFQALISCDKVEHMFPLDLMKHALSQKNYGSSEKFYQVELSSEFLPLGIDPKFKTIPTNEETKNNF